MTNLLITEGSKGLPANLRNNTGHKDSIAATTDSSTTCSEIVELEERQAAGNRREALNGVQLKTLHQSSRRRFQEIPMAQPNHRHDVLHGDYHGKDHDTACADRYDSRHDDLHANQRQKHCC